EHGIEPFGEAGIDRVRPAEVGHVPPQHRVGEQRRAVDLDPDRRMAGPPDARRRRAHAPPGSSAPAPRRARTSAVRASTWAVSRSTSPSIGSLPASAARRRRAASMKALAIAAVVTETKPIPISIVRPAIVRPTADWGTLSP